MAHGVFYQACTPRSGKTHERNMQCQPANLHLMLQTEHVDAITRRRFYSPFSSCYRRGSPRNTTKTTTMLSAPVLWMRAGSPKKCDMNFSCCPTMGSSMIWLLKSTAVLSRYVAGGPGR